MSKPDEALTAYYAEAGSWAHDRQDELIRSRRVAWRISAAVLVVAACEALALMFLMPLKRVEPYTLMVNRQTGAVQLLKPLDPELVSSDAALTQSFLVQYVIAREGFVIETIRSDYRKVTSWSAGSAKADYVATMAATNPASPLALYPRSTIIDVQVTSVTSLGKAVALVRFETVRKDAGHPPAAPRDWVAVIHYAYSGRPMTMEGRFVNPLGFQVLRYRRSAENLPRAADPTPSGAGPVPASSRTTGTASQPPFVGPRDAGPRASAATP